jgi:hypothetical protein
MDAGPLVPFSLKSAWVRGVRSRSEKRLNKGDIEI